MTSKTKNSIERPPIIVVLGHIDHGKSTLLDYIRKTNTTEKEAGGITQHISAYEVVHKTSDGKESRITFLDTPGHEAFTKMRARGANLADIAILVISAEDGVKAQTLEVLKVIQESRIPYVVAISKIDKPNANTEKIKQELAEHKVFVEGYGGDIPAVPLSAKTGEGIPELLDMMLLVAELQELKGNPDAPAEGVVLESHINPKEGVSATLIIKNGTLKRGMFVAAGNTLAPVRKVNSFLDHNAPSATFSSPLVLTGFDSAPDAGILFRAFETKKEAKTYIKEIKEEGGVLASKPTTQSPSANDKKGAVYSVPIILKADTTGSLEALEHEVLKLKDKVGPFQIIHRGIGNIEESDLKVASSGKGIIVVGLHVSVGKPAERVVLQQDITTKTFNIIYELTEWLLKEIKEKTPKTMVEEKVGTAKILRVFNKTKGKHVIGGKVIEGTLSVGSKIKIVRREKEIDRGEIVELQQQKVKTGEVKEGFEFGAMINSKHDITPGDVIEVFTLVEK